ncbi:hypothetical protein [Cytobacillus sp. IB215665]|uniref:hypothetical protein n=1 Tax=Cytobacillus sp. IB215665 TaxID=3097357 RepID=UPI002A14143F|nr:hypothetical protein [Cytobacillus sp. IB215665]MDX8366528.1 hypothetical protein [Cytobacillus sp. IB215665]
MVMRWAYSSIMKNGIIFDPTVFENLKVVLEGEIYDLDLDGTIEVINRDDLVNLATMSRSYKINFQLKDRQGSPTAYMKLSMDVANLSKELLQTPGQKPGCSISIGFLQCSKSVEGNSEHALKIVQSVWGQEYIYHQTISHNPSEHPTLYTHRTDIIFDRFMYEENIDDLIEMIDFIICTLQQL